MREIDTLVASLEELVAEVSSDRRHNDATITAEEQESMMLMGRLEMERRENDDDSEDEEDNVTALATNGGHRPRRFHKFRQRLRGVRVGRPSWWTECKNIETTGCSFALAYIVLSFVLMTAMFNMREIVGDYCLGNKERADREHEANVIKAMMLRRRRSPLTLADQEDRFEREIEAALYYDKQGQLGDDEEYLKKHRVPILLPYSEEMEGDEQVDDLMLRDDLEP